jgi:myosin heavy subunit
MEQEALVVHAAIMQGLHSLTRSHDASSQAEGTKNTIRMEYTTLFGIEHYAGRVVYDGQGFLERNADSLWGDLVDLLGQSANTIAAAMFEDLRSAEEKAKRPVSLSLQFRRQVKELTIALAQCRPHYVRCIKPNETKSPNDFDIQRVAHQVRLQMRSSTSQPACPLGNILRTCALPPPCSSSSR